MLEMFLDRINRIERSGSMKKKIMFVALAVVAMAWCPTAYADEGSDTVGWTPLAVDIWTLGRTNAHVIAIPPRDWNVAGLSLGGLHLGGNAGMSIRPWRQGGRRA